VRTPPKTTIRFLRCPVESRKLFLLSIKTEMKDRL